MLTQNPFDDSWSGKTSRWGELDLGVQIQALQQRPWSREAGEGIGRRRSLGVHAKLVVAGN
jgi:hypothetical protein